MGTVGTSRVPAHNYFTGSAPLVLPLGNARIGMPTMECPSARMPEDPPSASSADSSSSSLLRIWRSAGKTRRVQYCYYYLWRHWYLTLSVLQKADSAHTYPTSSKSTMIRISEYHSDIIIKYTYMMIRLLPVAATFVPTCGAFAKRHSFHRNFFIIIESCCVHVHDDKKSSI